MLPGFVISSGVKRAILDDWAISWMWGDWSKVDVKSFLAIDIPLPPFPSTDGIVIKIPNLDRFWYDIEPAFIQLLNKMDGVRNDIYERINDYKLDIKLDLLNVSKVPRLLPEDYNPPQYAGSQSNVIDLETEQELHSNITKVRAETSYDYFSLYLIFEY